MSAPGAICRLLLAAAALAACSPAPTEDRPTSVHRAPITDGIPDTQHAAVGLLVLEVPDPDDPASTVEAICTATLVGEFSVLTAAHCFDEDVRAVRFELGENDYLADSWSSHPDYQSFPTLFDLALVRLVESPPIAPHPVAYLAPEVGMQITLVGFGETDWGRRDHLVKRTATNTITEVSDHELNMLGTGEGKGSVCRGDSGGPVLFREDDVEVIYGVNSHSDYDYPLTCGVSEWAARVDIGLTWLRQVTAGDIAVQGEPSAPPADVPMETGSFTDGILASDARPIADAPSAADGSPPPASAAKGCQLAPSPTAPWALVMGLLPFLLRRRHARSC